MNLSDAPMADRASTAIQVRNLGKRYQIYAQPHDRLKQSLLPRAAKLLGRRQRDYFTEFWALRDVSFDIARGETVGIVGRNGSGKSTLLQVICGTLTPTTGEVEVRGRVAALLELGAGFNPEFTGRENVYLNASVMGLSREEIDQRYDAICAFADIGQFVEQPVKTYSSGMTVRLAFAVAINVDPEILIIDEALAVGDERFQRKCYSRIEDIKADGATVLFVSHSGAIVIELCDHALLLDDGRQLAMGSPKQIVGRYQRLLYAPPQQRASIREEIIAEGPTLLAEAAGSDSSGPGLARESLEDLVQERFDPSLKPISTVRYASRGVDITDPLVTTLSGVKVNNLRRGVTYRYCYTASFSEPAANVRFGMLIKTVAGVYLGGGSSAASSSEGVTSVPAGTVYSVEFRFVCRLNVGTYFLDCGVLGKGSDGEETFLHRLLDAVMFRVLPEAGSTSTGTVDFDCLATLNLENSFT
jgi:lipopolysaccharide transport system ATP-binding protein